MAMQHVADTLSAESEPREDGTAPWHNRAIIATVISAVSAIAGASLYLLLTDVGGLAALVALPAVVAVVAPGVAGLVYTLSLATKIRRNSVLANAFEAIQAPRAILDSELRVVAANAAYRRVFGHGGTNPLDILMDRVGDDPEAAKNFAELRAAAQRCGRAEAQLTLTGSDAGRWYRFEVGPADDEGRLVMLSVDDTTALKRAELALRRDYDALAEFADRLPIGLYSVDGEGRFRFVNATMAQWLGLKPAELIGGTARLHDFIDGALPTGTALYDPFGGGADVGEVTLIAGDGSRRNVVIGQLLETGEREAGIHTRSAAFDLAALPGMEADAEASERDFGKIFADAPVGVAMLDLDGVLTQCNGAFCEMAGGHREALIGQALVDLFAADERPDLAQRIADVAAGGEARSPIEIRPAARPDVSAALYVNPLTGSRGKPTGLMVHSLDSTDQRNLEIQFAQSQKMQAVGQLAGGIAHDFNNLLTAMIGFCDLLLLRHRPGEESFADIMQIKQNANRAANLVRQLLAFSRQQTLEPKVLNVTDVLTELTHLLRRLIGENIELKMAHGRDLGLVRVDQGQFEQVIINLVVNARDAMTDGGTLTIRTSDVSSEDPIRRGHEIMPAGDYTVTEVIDTGHGIPKENLGRIFEPFYSTKEIGSGTGLGLSTVYGIVKQTGGFVFVDSEAGAGARFSIYLPRHEPDETATSQRKSAGSEDRRDLTGVGSVLLVEDEDAVRLFGARALRNKGYQVTEAASGEEALKLVEEGDEPIDLLITDVVMPNMDGPSLIRRVREIRPDLKVICISGYAEDAFRKRIDQSADIHFLPKPFSLQQLAGKVKDVMQTASD